MNPKSSTLIDRSKLSLSRWLLKGNSSNEEHHQYPWWKVMCLTGVDYFSTLGYQPGIAILAAGSLAPISTFILILLTLFGALPIYRWVAKTSPNGEGSIAMLESLLSWWQGKLLVLILLGFVGTDFIITITLSAADATAHLIENPWLHPFLQGHQVEITLLLVGMLGVVFLKGFQEAIDLAVILVIAYLFLNFIVIGKGISLILNDPSLLVDWQRSLFAEHHNNVLEMLGISALLFPKLALGLSGFETGVAVMPLIKGAKLDDEGKPITRIQNTYKLLTTAALIMSFFLLTSSFVTMLLIKPAEFQPGGQANGRALAYMSHLYLGDAFGTVYDLSTISILWFAGASAMAGLLNIVPRYLPRYGMAPFWTTAVRPLVLVYTAIAFFVTMLFKADVDAQGGAYATGVLVLMSSAAFAVALLARKKQKKRGVIIFSLITLVFLYTTIVNVRERPEGLHIAGFFIGAIVVTSLISRVWRSTELRSDRVEMDEMALSFIDNAGTDLIRLVANRRHYNSEEEYLIKAQEVREDNHIPNNAPILFLEIQVIDASDFTKPIIVEGTMVGECQVLKAYGTAVPNTIAAILLSIRDRSNRLPHAYFGWIEGNPIQYLLRFILFGEGDIAVVTREVLRTAEPNSKARPAIHVGG
jgi:hypothetical protein